MLKLMDLKQPHRDKYLDECILLTDIITEQLDHTRQTNPLKLMGFTTSYELLTSICTAMVSFLFAISQLFYTDINQ